MKNLNRWIIPALWGALLIVMEWMVEDIAAQSYFWDKTPEALLSRLYAFIMVVGLAPIYYNAVQNKMLLYFENRNREKMLAYEYLFVLLILIMIVSIPLLFNYYFINCGIGTRTVWESLLMAYGMFIPPLFLLYVTQRSNRISAEYERQAQQMEKIKNNQLETELKYLRAQYHPHFLFNALNTVYFQIDDPKADAKNTVELLSELLRYQLYNVEKEVKISEEINFIQTYIRFQQLRMSKRLTMNVSIDNALSEQKIYPLIYQPFLENAFKYVGGEYRIKLEMKLLDGQIIFSLENSLPEHFQQTRKSNAGIGIENIKRRLALLYPDRHRLNIKQEEKSFIVELLITPNTNDAKI